MSRDQIQVGNATTLAPSQRQQALYDHLDQPAHTLYSIPPIISSNPAPILVADDVPTREEELDQFWTGKPKETSAGSMPTRKRI
ncbi:hypothetical protein PGTUg99_000223 [Puccinia graminis f. sp. tritici]|uniref:Uncharacterized protein n=1 Tax=Puccinia graminis f. sp. tritici TaxID=56615 RepID=A0A5B0PDB5_PUCGR|nr:hypothetical protein PGTUg99_000223 [Puccinia graminis f. sp. tritici]